MTGWVRRSAIAITAAALLSAGAAEACRCVRQSPAKTYRQAHAVLLATIRSSREVSAYDRTYRIEVERSWKRPLKTLVAVNSTRSSCLAELEPGKTYLLYVVRDPSGTMRTSSCDAIPEADARTELAWLERRR
ncbi:MAG TPA: hypothetical protein VF695_13330 [Sphingomonas sp.]|jgi:hypothetical protein